MAALVLVGAVDWRRAAWRGRFYPDSLPEDWELSYYNTQFQAVYLPVDAWMGVAESTWSQWLYDTHEGFVFVLEPMAGAAPPTASTRVVIADPVWAQAHIWWLDESTDLRALARRITEHAARSEPLFIFSRNGDLARLEEAQSLRHVMGY